MQQQQPVNFGYEKSVALLYHLHLLCVHQNILSNAATATSKKTDAKKNQKKCDHKIW
jgi:hypothetical protein